MAIHTVKYEQKFN